MAAYAKAIVAGVVAVLIAGLTAAQVALEDDTLTTAEWVTIGLAVVGAVGVWWVKNKEPDQP